MDFTGKLAAVSIPGVAFFEQASNEDLGIKPFCPYLMQTYDSHRCISQTDTMEEPIGSCHHSGFVSLLYRRTSFDG